LLIVITFKFHIEIVFQSTKFEQKLFNQETLRERAAITVQWLSTHGPWADQRIFIG
jgi:hypothetical protein